MSDLKPASSSAQSAPTVSPRDQLLKIVKSLQFAWFSGHLLTLLFGFLYLFTSRNKNLARANTVFYKLAYLSIIESFSIIVWQSQKNGLINLTKPADFRRSVLSDDNVQYVLIAVCLLLFVPVVTISLFPFLIFSFFHCLNYFASTILPVLPLNNARQLIGRAMAFINTYNDISMYYAANMEMWTFFYITFRMLIWSRGFLVAFVLYGLFIRLRYEKSIFTRTCFKKLEVRVDGLVSHPSLPPAAKKYWIDFKTQFKSYSGQFRLTQEKKAN